MISPGNHKLSCVGTLLILALFQTSANSQQGRPDRGQSAKLPPVSEPRVALVIGNSAYRDSPLPNPVNDARDMAAALKEVGFEVISGENLNQAQMKRAIAEFGHLNEIYSLSNFHRNAKQHITRMKKKRRPVALTINGKAEMVGMDIATFQELLEAIETIEGIRRGLESKKRGEGKSLEEFDVEMRKKYNIPRKPQK